MQRWAGLGTLLSDEDPGTAAAAAATMFSSISPQAQSLESPKMRAQYRPSDFVPQDIGDTLFSSLARLYTDP
jgi:hypothetical protein